METDNESAAATTVEQVYSDDGLNAARLGLAVAAGLGAAIAGAVVWAVITVATEYELGIMAVAVGFMVGKAIATVANSRNQAFGFVGAACSLVGCVLGNLFSGVGFAAQGSNIGYFDALSRLDPSLAIQIMTATFSPMDLIFYAIGIYEGYRFSIVR